MDLQSFESTFTVLSLSLSLVACETQQKGCEHPRTARGPLPHFVPVIPQTHADGLNQLFFLICFGNDYKYE